VERVGDKISQVTAEACWEGLAHRQPFGPSSTFRWSTRQLDPRPEQAWGFDTESVSLGSPQSDIRLSLSPV